MNYARKKGFDPLIADNWYDQESITAEQVNTTKSKTSSNYLKRDKESKDANTVFILLQEGRTMFYHQCNFKNTLPALFPEIGLDISKFKTYGMIMFLLLFDFASLL